MRLDRLAYDPAALVDFYEQGFGSLGALCERTWHDRLDIVAEGRAAELWNPGGALHEIELHFASADASGARDSAREVFPGCPLTFRLAEALRPSPLPLERVVWVFPYPLDIDIRFPEGQVLEVDFLSNLDFHK